MKKLFRIFGINLIILNSSIVVIGCRPASLGEIWVLTDGGDLFDKAFNQQVVEGSDDFVSEFNKNRELISKFPGFENWKSQEMRLKWIIAKDGDLATLQNNYNIASYAGAKTIICVGFHHISALTLQLQRIYQDLGVKFILVDSELNNPINVAGLTYASDESGYLAGLAGAIWLAANYEQYQSNGGLKMSTFGGLPSDVIVRIMMGYYWGVEYFNQYKSSDDLILTMVNSIRTNNGKEEMTKDQLTSSSKNVIFDKLQNSFTNGFDSGSNNARVITSQLINVNKNDIVLPVAGAQTTDLISAIVNSQDNKTAKIIGVDVDQSQQYHYAEKLFITSALKGIHSSVNWMLWNSFNLAKDENNQIIEQPDGEKYFNGQEKYTPLGGKEYTGIANNRAIEAIYQSLDNQKYWDLAQKVSIAFDKLNADLTNVTDSKKWDNAWQTAVNKENPDYRPDFGSIGTKNIN
ncbi:MAG: BMP family ABC transporter substrate-binding protein [Spiroplasma sp.]|nr:BMP family ABC transporter substrate-binding protein [Spiroplasma sp.]